MSRSVQKGCIASCVRYFLLPDRTHTWRLHFFLCSVLHVNSVHSLFRHLHVVHGLSYPLSRLSLRLTVTLCGVVCNLLSHSLHRMILGDNSAGFTLRKKQFRDFSLLSAGCCPYREWASLVSCLVFSILAHRSLQIFDIGWFQASCDGSACTV